MDVVLGLRDPASRGSASDPFETRGSRAVVADRAQPGTMIASEHVMVRAFGQSETGRRRRNEDSFAVRPDLGLFVVADGMGGHAGGNVASRLVVETVERFFDQMGGDSDVGLDQNSQGSTLAEQRMDLAIRMCKREVERKAVGDLAPMGTTLVTLLVRDGRAVLAHVGDSRIYRLRNGRIEQMTRDHSLCAELEAAGGQDLAKRLTGPFTAMVTRSIAAYSNAKPDIRIEDMEPGDRYLLCTDGLSGALEPEAIAAILRTYEEPQEASCRLVQRALAAGSMDNVTAVVVDPS